MQEFVEASEVGAEALRGLIEGLDIDNPRIYVAVVQFLARCQAAQVFAPPGQGLRQEFQIMAGDRHKTFEILLQRGGVAEVIGRLLARPRFAQPRQ